MKIIILLSALAVTLCGCYGYKTTRTIKSAGNECSYSVGRIGNSVIGYEETDMTNEERAEKECKEWLKK
jgi:flavodoxin